MKITLGGYYGFDNLGDEITLFLLISDIKKEYPEADVRVISRKACHGVKTVSRSDLGQIKKTLAESDIFILGGGSLIQDATSLRSLFYYCELIKLAHRLGCAVCIIGGGIGPLRHREYAREALSLCRYISVRDKASMEILNEMNIPCSLSADRIFTAPSADRSGCGRYFTVNLRECAGRRRIRTEAFTDGVYPFVREGLTPVYVSMQDSYDLEICKKTMEKTGGRITTPRSLDELLRLQRGARFAVGMRLHFLLAASLAHCPTLSLSYDPKSSCIPTPSLDAFSFHGYELTEAVKKLEPTEIPEGSAELCRADVARLRQYVPRKCENVRECLK